jgi:hypothetical protein
MATKAEKEDEKLRLSSHVMAPDFESEAEAKEVDGMAIVVPVEFCIRCGAIRAEALQQDCIEGM